MALDLNGFQLKSSVLEYRYPSNFLIWDQVGTFWSRLLANYPDATVKHADPNKTQIRINSELEGLVGIDRANISTIGKNPDRDTFVDLSERFTKALIEILQISSFSRIGYRNILSRAFPEKSEAAAYVFEFCLPHKLDKSYFGIEGKPLEPELGLRWEGEALGCHVRIAARTVKWDIDIPAEVPISEPSQSSRTQHSVVVDIDYYAHAPTEVEKVNIKELLGLWSRMTRRDIGKLFDGR